MNDADDSEDEELRKRLRSRESRETIRAFIAWWNEKSFFPFDDGQDDAAVAPRKMAA